MTTLSTGISQDQTVRNDPNGITMTQQERVHWKFSCLAKAVEVKTGVTYPSNDIGDATVLELAKKFEEYIFG